MKRASSLSVLNIISSKDDKLHVSIVVIMCLVLLLKHTYEEQKLVEM